MKEKTRARPSADKRAALQHDAARTMAKNKGRSTKSKSKRPASILVTEEYVLTCHGRRTQGRGRGEFGFGGRSASMKLVEDQTSITSAYYFERLDSFSFQAVTLSEHSQCG